jgi:hypothetical protein
MLEQDTLGDLPAAFSFKMFFNCTSRDEERKGRKKEKKEERKNKLDSSRLSVVEIARVA